ncbi:MAG: XcyI family restriction endonuclease [Prevotella sp.]|nr:XcyI family restriction endonuclease [Prevotella sp.]
MPKVPETVVKESYLLRSTFTYNKLRSEGYFDLFMKLSKFARVEGPKLNWDSRSEWNVSEEAWNILQSNKIAPMLVFIHPKVLQLNPSFLKYYRSVSLIPQKGLSSLSKVSSIDRIEEGKVEAGRLKQEQIERLVRTINETLSLIITLASDLSEKKIEGMMYATAGVKIDGSWRNQIGAEGERVIRRIIFNELFAHNDISSIESKKDELTEIALWDESRDVDMIKKIHLVNGYSILFSSEPDVTMYNDSGAIVGIIEIKSGLDPAGALERLGAMFKSFENTLAEYPDAVTILVASCITKEVDKRLNASMSVRQRYLTTDITSSDAEKRRFVNRLRVIMQLVGR